MTELLLSLLFLGFIDPQSDAARDRQNNQPDAPLVVVAEGSSRWQGRAVETISALPGSRKVEVAWFDADTEKQAAVRVPGASDVVALRPRTPMHEAIATCLGRVERGHRQRSMVVIAHEQFYSTAVPERHLIESAQRSEVTVHTIHLAQKTETTGAFRCFGRAVINGLFWFVGTLLQQEGESYSAAETARLLKRLAEATGGKACVAVDEKSTIACAAEIGAVLERAAP